MNILYFIPKISKSDGGIYQYAYNLLSELANHDIKYNYFVQIEKPEVDYLELCRKYKNIDLISGKGALEPFSSKIIRGLIKLMNKIFEKLDYKIRFKVQSEIVSLIRKYKIDIVHCPHQTLPSNIEVPTIVTIHDLQELHFPEFFTSEQRKVRAIDNCNSINSSSAIIVSYDHIKHDIQKYFKQNKDKIQTVLLNMNNLWFNNTVVDQNNNFQCLFDSYILYPAATWEHKNHINLIKSLHYLKTKKNIVVNLICTGNKTDYYNELDNLVCEMGLKNQVVFTGIVSDTELLFLYKNANAVVIPTLYEAGSFPLYESMFLNVPVICSNVTSLPETIGHSDFVFEPTDIIDIANKIEKITSDNFYIQKNLSVTASMVGCFKNQPVAQKFQKIYISLIEKQIY